MPIGGGYSNVPTKTTRQPQFSNLGRHRRRNTCCVGVNQDAPWRGAATSCHAPIRLSVDGSACDTRRPCQFLDGEDKLLLRHDLWHTRAIESQGRAGGLDGCASLRSGYRSLRAEVDIAVPADLNVTQAHGLAHHVEAHLLDRVPASPLPPCTRARRSTPTQPIAASHKRRNQSQDHCAAEGCRTTCCRVTADGGTRPR
jgi:hypothetical protein